MRELVAGLPSLIAAGEPFAMATLIGVRGSSPRPVGTSMVVAADGRVIGSLSGGCVEAAVHAAALEALDGASPAVHHYGLSDDDAFAVGLTCGGTLDVLVARVGADEAAWLARVLDAIEQRQPVATATVIGGPAPLGARMVVLPDEVAGSLGSIGLDGAAADDALGLLAAGHDGIRHYGASGERRVDDVSVLIQSFAPPARMIVFGAIDFATAVCRAGVFLGYDVTVCDARPVFATAERFPGVADVVCAWPHDYLATAEIDARTVICVLTHDPKFDVPVLEIALASPAAYIGAMGSRRTHADRLDRLRERGVTEAALARLRSPIGLDIGARTPEETAISIAAEIVQQRWGGSGRPLSGIEGAIHGTWDRQPSSV